MKRLIYCLLLIGVALIFGVTACVPKGAEAPKGLPKIISYGALAPPAVAHAVAVAHGSILKKYAGIDVTVEPVGPPKAQVDLMRKKELELAHFDSYAGTWAYEGIGIFQQDGPQAIRLLMTGNSLEFGVVARADRGIKSISDLKGKKVNAIWPAAPALEVYARAVLKAYGLTFDDITAIKYSTTDEHTDSMISGRIDAYFSNVGIRPQVEQIDKAVGAYIIPISHDPKVLDVIRQSLPMASPIWFKSGYPGAKLDTPSIGIPMYLYARADIDDNLAYTIVKTLLEHYDELKVMHPALAQWTLDNAVKNTEIPFHAGAIKYYKEKGVWTKQLEEKQKKLLSGK